ncbi:hypothetical protein [Rhodanobacter sp. DHG33]|uniref:hypothetical protein n=1 Tax=Rhodanobacter sp. DHG33 TaxID=2775921 RepID=UPI00177F6CF8|nr:hypothetical protein [Rhodanobacter sp. DHG33]MBD8898883.1 hypothetical protein [Rhodanobacter sp. DHG33]
MSKKTSAIVSNAICRREDRDYDEREQSFWSILAFLDRPLCSIIYHDDRIADPACILFGSNPFSCNPRPVKWLARAAPLTVAATHHCPQGEPALFQIRILCAKAGADMTNANNLREV